MLLVVQRLDWHLDIVGRGEIAWRMNVIRAPVMRDGLFSWLDTTMVARSVMCSLVDHLSGRSIGQVAVNEL